MSRSTQRLRSLVAVVLITGFVGVATPARAAVPDEVSPTAQVPKSDAVSTAIAKARKEGEPAPVTSLTDEYSTTAANPDGTLTRTSSSSPQRVRKNGTWVPIDTTLVRQEDGSFAPRATVYSLTVSGGGSSRLLTLKDGSRSLRFGWSKKLPEPVVSGDTATYQNVYPGVDLQVIADATGYSSMLVVKSAKAAANPALARVDFSLTGEGVSIREARGGGAEATDVKSGSLVFHTDTAAMWDSSPATGEDPAAGLDAAHSARDARVAAGRLGGHRSRIAVAIRGAKQSLSLDRTLLTAKTTKFPVFVDPYWSGNPSQVKWARISSNGWNVYNSTSKTGATSARIGYDNWPTGAAERARTYYQMNTAGIRGATIFEANLYVVERWAASCYNTAAVVYGTAAPSGWSSSSLYWGHEPARQTGVLSTVNGQELDCGKSTIRVSPASLKFNVLAHITTVAKAKASTATFLVQAKDMDDKFSWKQLGYGGGATLSVRYSYKPQLLNGTGTPRITPSVVDQGRNLTTTRTPTLSAKGVNPKVNGIQEKVRIEYLLTNSAGKVTTAYSGWSLNGEAWTTPALPDGKYTWKATVENASLLYAGVFTATQTFVVDTSAPHQPTVKSSQFPPDMSGGGYTDKGVFVLGNDRTNNVTGYLFSLDNNLANVVYAPGKSTAWTAGTTLAAGTIYYAKADNGNGTGTAVVNGNAGISFAPVTAGWHTLYVKAVDQAGSTSPQLPYTFAAGTSTPAYATGSKLISGWTAPNTDGTTTVVPPATTTSVGGKLVSQSNPAGMYFADGFQAVLGNTSTTKVAKGDKATFSFNIPQTGLWEIGANLTTGTADGIYDLVLDEGRSTSTGLLTGFDAYSSPATPGLTYFKNFGVIKDGAKNPLTLEKGVHTLTFTMTGLNPASAGYQAGIDVIRLAPVPTCTISNTTGCLNNAAISTYTAGTTPTVTAANADGPGSSFESADLKAAGWNPGNTITVNGAAIKLSAAFGTGAADNMLSSGQFVTVPATGVVNKGNALVFLGFATGGPANGATGTINYAAGSCRSSQPFTIDSVSDWTAVPASEAVLTLPRYNKSNATRVAASVSVSAFSVPLLCPGAVVESIVLPVVTNVPQAGKPALHILGMGIRPTSASDTVHWVGSWAAAQDTPNVQTKVNGTGTTNVTLSGQTLRIPARLSIGTGGDTQKVRVHLANSLGTTPVTFDAASIAVQDSTTGGATAAAAPIPLAFGGLTTVTLAAGADIVSDPVTLTVPERTTVLVSLKTRGAVAAVAGHRDTRFPIYASAADSTDHTGERAASNFTTANIAGMPYLAGIDVTTPAGNPAGALVLFGDQTVNSDTADGDGLHQIDAKLADALADAGDGTGTVPFGILNEGSSSWSNRIQLPAGNVSPAQNATALTDRAILSQANVRIALISAGSTDLLACNATTADACATPVQNKLVALASQLHSYKTDDVFNPAATLPSTTGNLKVYVATLPPFTTAHTAVQEAAREQVNDFILGADATTDLQGYADGIINFAAAVSTDGTETSDTVLSDYTYVDGTNIYPSNLYYEVLAEAYLTDSDRTDRVTDDQSGGTEDGADPVAVWKFDDGTGTTAADTGTGTGTTNTVHPATLTDVAWGPGRQVDRKAATFNGTSSYASTTLTVATSFTVSAWVRLADKSADRTVFTRNTSGRPSLTLQYQKSSDHWRAEMTPAGTGTPYELTSDLPAQTGAWTHLAVTYNAELQRLSLYVNGDGPSVDNGDISAVDDDSDGSATANAAPLTEAAAATWIGRGADNWFAGDIGEVRVWARELTQEENDTWITPELMADWELEEGAGATVAHDSTVHQLDGTLTGGADWTYPGHREWDIAAVRLNGTDAGVTSGPLALTDQSFSVAAWVRITDTDADHTVLSQDGAHTGRFMLQWSKDCTCWRFLSANTDTAATATTVSEAPASSPLNTWTHLAAVYDATTNQMTLYVNGTPTPPAAVSTEPWRSAGSFVVGRGRSNDHDTDWFAGDIDAVHVYQGAISGDKVDELMNS